MQSEFSAPLTRLDVVLWFLRAQLWISVAALLLGCFSPYFYSAVLGVLSLENIATLGLPVLLLALFPRNIAFTVLGGTAQQSVSHSDLRLLVGRCVGVTLFIGSLGRVVILTGNAFVSSISLHKLTLGIAYSQIYVWAQFIGTAVAFFLGFALAFGPSLRDHFQERPGETDSS